MIEKIKPRDSREVEDTDEFTLTGSALKKINQLIDKVNQFDPIITNLVNTSIEDGNRLLSFRDTLDSIRKMVNIHEKEIDKLQMKVEPEKCDIPDGDDAIQEIIHEQQKPKEKWVGHLCKFYDDDNKFCFGLLAEIDKGSIYPYCCMPSETYWEHCELIKPDSRLIFKGDKDVIQ